jgi:Asp/Glu/hydantoin racemase
MPTVRLINPNASAATTAMMARLVAAELPAGFAVATATAAAGPTMIVTADELAAAAPGVVAMGRAGGAVDAVIVAAFGDPGLDDLRAVVTVPVVGIFEASCREAAAGGRRFAIATVTPGLADILAEKVARLGLANRFSGIRLTAGDPRALSADPDRLEAALAVEVDRCLRHDGAEAVIIGGGPLGQAAVGLARRFAVPVIAPLAAAARAVTAALRPTA